VASCLIAANDGAMRLFCPAENIKLQQNYMGKMAYEPVLYAAFYYTNY
jgi:hypothetical protein